MKEKFVLLKNINDIYQIYATDFDSFYNANQDDFIDLENKYKKEKIDYKKNLIKYNLSLFIVMILFIILYNISDPLVLFFVNIAAMVMIYIFIKKYVKIRFDVKKFDSYIFDRIISHNQNQATYQFKSMDREKIEESNLYPNNQNYISHIIFSGQKNNCQYTITKIDFRKVNKMEKQAYPASQLNTIYYKIQCKDFDSKAIVSIFENESDEYTKKYKTGLQKVNLEDIDFKRYYDIYSDNQIQARVLLEPRVMEQLNELMKTSKRKVHYAFKHQDIYIQVPVDSQYFKNNLLISSLNLKQEIMEYYCEYRAVIDFIDDILSLYEIY